jgi:hypothetical protein
MEEPDSDGSRTGPIKVDSAGGGSTGISIRLTRRIDEGGEPRALCTATEGGGRDLGSDLDLGQGGDLCCWGKGRHGSRHRQGAPTTTDQRPSR